MTFSKNFKTQNEGLCSTCQEPMVERAAYPYPVLVQTVFGISFVAFILVFDHIQHLRWLIWSWTFLSVTLGIILIRLRLRAKKRVYRCLRCTN